MHEQMNIEKEPAMVNYCFGSKMSFVDAFTRILESEKIPYTTGAGPNGYVVCVEEKHLRKVTDTIQQWYEAMPVIHRGVWARDPRAHGIPVV